LHQLDAIAEGIAKLEAFTIRNPDGLDDEHARCFEFAPRFVQINYLKGNVAFGSGAVGDIFRAEVQKLIAADIEPQATALLQSCRLRHFPQTEHAAIKTPHFILAIHRHADLHMIHTLYLHLQSPFQLLAPEARNKNRWNDKAFSHPLASVGVKLS